MSSQYVNLPGYGNYQWKAPVATAAALPTVNNLVGDARIAKDTSVIYVWDGSFWVANAGTAGVSSLNGLTGALTLAAGANITITPSGGNTLTIAATSSGSGTVTSVALADASTSPIYSVSGSPVTTAGTLSLTLATQTANKVFAGPTTGSPAQPTFRSLVSADIPALSYVTSVALADSTGLFNITGSPVTSSGTLTLSSFQSQAQHAFFAGPSGASGAPTFRAIVASDVPTLNQNTTGTASNITAVTNSTLTTLSSLSLPFTQVSGQATLSQIQNIANNTVLGNVSGISAAPAALTPTQLTTLINSFTSSLSGAAPASGGGTTNFLRADGTWASPGTGSGTVTSVALSDGSSSPIYSISGSPVTTSGTLTFTLATQSANTVFAGPTTGSAAQPTFRSLVSADIPNNAANTSGTAANITASSNTSLTTLSNLVSVGAITTGTWNATTIAIAHGGTGQTSASAAFNALSPITTAGDLILGNGSNSATRLAIGANTFVLTSNGTTASWAAPAAGSGTVTSVDMSVPAFLSVSGNPITTSGTLAVTLSGAALPIANGGTAKTSVTTVPIGTSWAGWDANSNLSANNFIAGFGGVTFGTPSTNRTLVVSDVELFYITNGGNSGCTVTMPVVSTLVTGQSWILTNGAGATVTILSSGGNTIQAMAPSTVMVITCISVTGTTASSWSYTYNPLIGSSVGVTSVALSDGSSSPIYTITGSPVTTTGTLTFSLATQTANKVFAGPTSGGAAQPSFRALVSADIPNNAANTSGSAASLSATLVVGSGGTGVTSVTIAPTATAFAGWDANKNLSANAFIPGFTTAATANSTLTMTITSTQQQYFTGTTAGQVVKLPTTSVVAGMSYTIVNNSNQTIAVQSSGANAIQTMAAATQLVVTAIVATPTTAANWNVAYGPTVGGTVTSVALTVPSFLSVSGSPVTSTGTLAISLSGTALPIANGGTGQTTASAAFNALSPITSTGDLILGNGSNSATRLAIGANNTVLKSNGTTASWGTVPTPTYTAPTIQRFLSGSGTYTTPAGVLYIRVKAIGGGGAGAAAGFSSPGAGGNGVDTTFGTSLITAGGGTGGSGTSAARGGAGGSATIASSGTVLKVLEATGSYGNGAGALGTTASSSFTFVGGMGGNGYLGGNGSGGASGTASAASANSGAGGGGGGMAGDLSSTYSGGEGGGSGGYCEAIITSPSSTYAYAVGSGGAQNSGANGTGTNGGNGGSGIIIVEEFYQ